MVLPAVIEVNISAAADGDVSLPKNSRLGIDAHADHPFPNVHQLNIIMPMCQKADIPDWADLNRK
ncbi:hypothetical protein D3C71_1642690 [compost metagenome]